MSVGSGPLLHDWGYLMERVGILEHDRTVARLFRGVGLALMGASVLTRGRVTSRIRLKRPGIPPRHGG